MNQHPHKCGEESQCVTNQCHYTFFELTNQLWDTPTEHRDETFIPSHGIPIARFSVFVKYKPEKKKKIITSSVASTWRRRAKGLSGIVSGINSQTGAAIRPGWSGNQPSTPGGVFFLKRGKFFSGRRIRRILNCVFAGVTMFLSLALVLLRSGILRRTGLRGLVRLRIGFRLLTGRTAREMNFFGCNFQAALFFPGLPVLPGVLGKASAYDDSRSFVKIGVHVFCGFSPRGYFHERHFILAVLVFASRYSNAEIGDGSSRL